MGDARDRAASDASEGSEDGNDMKLTINRSFAKRFEEKKRRDDLFRAQAKGLLDGDDSSDDEEEDETGEALTPKLDLDIMKTMAMIRNKDKRIYDKDFQPFQGQGADAEDDDSDGSDGSETSEKRPLRYKDMVRKNVLDKMDGDGGGASEDEDEDGPVPGSYNANQAELKRKFKAAAQQAAEADDEDDEDGILKVKKKSPEEQQREEDEFKQYLQGLQKRDRRVGAGEDVQVLESFFREPAKDKGEEFLRKFVLNEGWVDKDNQMAALEDSDKDDEDLEALDEADRFEAKFNFRFEEPGADTIESHPRKDETSVRRRENARKRQREEKKRRKEEKQKRALEELRRLKNLKRQELESRLEKTAKVAGLKGMPKGFTAEDLDGDWDPEEFDRKMAQTFDDEYYNEEDQGLEDEGIDLLAPGPEDDLEDEEEERRAAVAKASAATDDESDGEGKGEGEELERPDRRREAAASKSKKKAVDPIEEELFKLDYEDTLMDGTKTRFKYRKVKPNSYGLTTEEILLADTKLLQSFVSLKRMAPYLEEEWHADTRQRRRFRQALKEQLKNKKQAAKEKRAKRRAEAEGRQGGKEEGEDAFATVDDEGNKEAERKDQAAAKDPAETAAAAEPEGGAKRKRKRKRKRGAANDDEAETQAATDASANKSSAAAPKEADADADADADDSGKRKRKRKRKKKGKSGDE